MDACAYVANFSGACACEVILREFCKHVSFNGVCVTNINDKYNYNNNNYNNYYYNNTNNHEFNIFLKAFSHP